MKTSVFTCDVCLTTMQELTSDGNYFQEGGVGFFLKIRTSEVRDVEACSVECLGRLIEDLRAPESV